MTAPVSSPEVRVILNNSSASPFTKWKPLFLSFSIIIIIVAGVSFYLWREKNGSFFNPQEEIPQSLLPTSPPKKGPTPTPFSETILYPQTPAPDGRDIYYARAKSYPGSGFHPMIYGPPARAVTLEKRTLYFVGTFDSWEKIEGTNDRYLIWRDMVVGEGEENLLPRIRIGFSQSAKLVKDYVTGLGVEDLSLIYPEVVSPAIGARAYSLGYIGFFSSKELEKLFKPGDALVVTIQRDWRQKNEEIDFVDNKQIRIAEWLYIRRFRPKEVIPKELGKQVDFKE